MLWLKDGLVGAGEADQIQTEAWTMVDDSRLTF